jgi:hypothetical protein
MNLINLALYLWQGIIIKNKIQCISCLNDCKISLKPVPLRYMQQLICYRLWDLRFSQQNWWRLIVVSLHEELNTEVQIAFALQLLNISRFSIITIFVMLDLQTLFHILFVQMPLVPLRENFHIPSSNGPLLITATMKAKFRICQKSVDIHN